MEQVNLRILEEIDAQIKGVDKEFSYGTAGFRCHASLLDKVIFRCGVLASIKSIVTNSTCGAMITASHNKSCDNGIKLVNADGTMFDAHWQAHAVTLVNTPNLASTIKKILLQEYPASSFPSNNALVVIGWDTRPSSPDLKDHFLQGTKPFSITTYSLGTVTTPQLHHITAKSRKTSLLPLLDYFHSYTVPYLRFLSFFPPSPILTQEIHLDCANGVVSCNVELLKNASQLCLIPHNCSKEGEKVNEDCGAEYVQKGLKCPKGFFEGGKDKDSEYPFCASVDGDGDRIVFFTKDKENNFQLIDGDRICYLISLTLLKLLNECLSFSASNGKELSVGVVQTAYANGASTKALQSLKNEIKEGLSFEVMFSKTGVYYQHKVAEKFDLSVYFEANGHGTIHVNKEKLSTWLESIVVAGCKEQEKCIDRFLCYLEIFNLYTGDAITDLLAAIASLHYLKLDIKDWLGLYEDYHVAQVKVPLSREVLNTVVPESEADRYLTEPKALQDTLEKVVAACQERNNDNSIRAFLRPSGTEDVCRLYCEALTEKALSEVKILLHEEVLRFFK